MSDNGSGSSEAPAEDAAAAKEDDGVPYSLGKGQHHMMTPVALHAHPRGDAEMTDLNEQKRELQEASDGIIGDLRVGSTGEAVEGQAVQLAGWGGGSRDVQGDDTGTGGGREEEEEAADKAVAAEKDKVGDKEVDEAHAVNEGAINDVDTPVVLTLDSEGGPEAGADGEQAGAPGDDGEQGGTADGGSGGAMASRPTQTEDDDFLEDIAPSTAVTGGFYPGTTLGEMKV